MRSSGGEEEVLEDDAFVQPLAASSSTSSSHEEAPPSTMAKAASPSSPPALHSEDYLDKNVMLKASELGMTADGNVSDGVLIIEEVGSTYSSSEGSARSSSSSPTHPTYAPPTQHMLHAAGVRAPSQPQLTAHANPGGAHPASGPRLEQAARTGRRWVGQAKQWLHKKREDRRQRELQRQIAEKVDKIRRHSTHNDTGAVMNQLDNDNDVGSSVKSVRTVQIVPEAESTRSLQNHNVLLDSPMSTLSRQRSASSHTGPPPFILEVDMLTKLAQHLPETLVMKRWKRVYSLVRDGDSFTTFLNHTGTYDKSVLIVKTTHEEVFGGYVGSVWDERSVAGDGVGVVGGPKVSGGPSGTFHGSAQAFLFKVVKKEKKRRKKNTLEENKENQQGEDVEEGESSCAQPDAAAPLPSMDAGKDSVPAMPNMEHSPSASQATGDDPANAGNIPPRLATDTLDTAAWNSQTNTNGTNQPLSHNHDDEKAPTTPTRQLNDQQSPTLSDKPDSESDSDSKDEYEEDVVVYKWTGANHYIQLCDVTQRKIAMGGGGHAASFGLVLEGDFSRGSSGPCDTFGNEGPLCCPDEDAGSDDDDDDEEEEEEKSNGEKEVGAGLEQSLPKPLPPTPRSGPQPFDVLDVEVWAFVGYA